MKKIGLVLAGGGGRGAYHIGVWEALIETGLDKYITAVSGTSVGGLNAALFVQGDINKAKDIWHNISVEKILSPAWGSREKIRKLVSEIKERGIHQFARTGMLEIIKQGLDTKVFDKSDLDCFITCTRTVKESINEFRILDKEMKNGSDFKSYNDGKASYFEMKEFSEEDRIKILLATSAIPFIFPEEKIGNYYYVDGGLKDNLPVQPLIYKSKCELIIVVHLERDVKWFEPDFLDFHQTILEIRPKKYQGGIIKGTLNFNADDATNRIIQGYVDNIETFRRISENIDSLSAGDERWRDIMKEDYIDSKRAYELAARFTNKVNSF